MINNRQGGRRGRGRNNNPARPQGGGGAPRTEAGNRIDNRSRGNANQLHEKYKTLARDAQMQGDRVMTEYYLQFADHYFRIINETRVRSEEQRRPRDDAYAQGPYGTDLDDDGEDDGEDMMEDRVDPRVRQSERPVERMADEGERVDRDRGDRGDRQQRFDTRNERPREDQRENRAEGRSSEPRNGDGRNNGANGNVAHNGTGTGTGTGNRDERPRDEPRAPRPPREPREEIRADRQPREYRDENRTERQPREEVRAERQPRDETVRPQGESRGDRTRRDRDGTRREREPRVQNGVNGAPANGNGAPVESAAPLAEDRFDVSVLPPSLAVAMELPLAASSTDAANDGSDEAPRTRRRRRTKAEMEAARAAAAASDAAA